MRKSQRLLNPRTGQIMLGRVSRPNGCDPGLRDAGTRGGGSLPHIGNGQRAQKGQNRRFFKLSVAIEPFLDSGVHVRVAVKFHPTAQARQMRGVRLGGGAVFVQMLHTVGIKRGAAHKAGVKQLVPEGATALASPGDGAMTRRALGRRSHR